jgi:hypothetical protein
MGGQPSGHRAIDRDMMSTRWWRMAPFPVSSARKPLKPFVFTTIPTFSGGFNFLIV